MRRTHFRIGKAIYSVYVPGGSDAVEKVMMMMLRLLKENAFLVSRKAKPPCRS